MGRCTINADSGCWIYFVNLLEYRKEPVNAPLITLAADCSTTSHSAVCYFPQGGRSGQIHHQCSHWLLDLLGRLARSPEGIGERASEGARSRLRRGTREGETN